jgi:hypothetical protein
MSKREIEIAVACPSLDDDDYEMKRSPKRFKLCDHVSPPLQLQKRRNSSVSTMFNVCKKDNAVVKTPTSIVIPKERSDVMESRELSEERSATEDETQEMRDMTETMRDMVSIRGCTRTA